MAKLLRKPLGSSLLWLFMGSHNSHYIFFSLVVKSRHKKLSLSLSLCVGRLHEEKWLPSSSGWTKSCWENDFGPIYGHLLCLQGSFHRSLSANMGDRPMSNTAIRRIHQRCEARLCLPKMLSFYLKFILLTMLPHIELPNCRYNQRFSEITSHFCPLLSFTALIDTDFLYKSFIAANSPRIPPWVEGFHQETCAWPPHSAHCSSSCCFSPLVQAAFKCR